jgi:hypothetical protein
MKLDPETLSPEARYRFEERLGILCGGNPPTPEQFRIAWLEAKECEMQMEDEV